MRRLVELGTVAATGERFTADLDLLLSSNLLVQANSGGGKSWLLRRAIEQVFGRVPQLIIDPEGEFSTLRGKFDVVLVGREGDTPADVRSAQLLAHKLLELGVSAVVDLFEVSPLVRPLWVSTFLQALVDAPKRLWRELLVYVDEAHVLAPEPGHGALDSEAHRRCRGSLIELASRGRKRGYGLVAATQRLGKLSKDFAAELKNVMVGQTFIDIDRERAAGSLGVAKVDRRDFDRRVKNLSPGQFFAMGRALVLEPTLVQVGNVQTEHPEAGRRQSAPPPPTDKIRHLLPQLADLPREAEQEVVTAKELRDEVAALKAELARKPVPEVVEKRVEVPTVPDEVVRKLDDARAKLENLVRIVTESSTTTASLHDSLVSLGDVARLYNQVRLPSKASPPTRPSPSPPARPIHYLKVRGEEPAGSELKLSRCARALLRVLAQRRVASASRLGPLAGYSRRSSGFANALSELRTAGLATGDRHLLQVTPGGLAAAGDVEAPPTGSALLEYWEKRLGKCEASLLRVVYARGKVTRAQLSMDSSYSATSSGFTNGLSVLRVLGLVRGPKGGDVEIEDVFKE